MISLLINANSATVQRSIKITVHIFTYNSKVFSLMKHLWALSLEGTPRDNLEIDPLAVLHLDNWLYMKKMLLNKGTCNDDIFIKYRTDLSPNG